MHQEVEPRLYVITPVGSGQKPPGQKAICQKATPMNKYEIFALYCVSFCVSSQIIQVPTLTSKWQFVGSFDQNPVDMFPITFPVDGELANLLRTYEQNSLARYASAAETSQKSALLAISQRQGRKSVSDNLRGLGHPFVFTARCTSA